MVAQLMRMMKKLDTTSCKISYKYFPHFLCCDTNYRFHLKKKNCMSSCGRYVNYVMFVSTCVGRELSYQFSLMCMYKCCGVIVTKKL